MKDSEKDDLRTWGNSLSDDNEQRFKGVYNRLKALSLTGYCDEVIRHHPTEASLKIFELAVETAEMKYSGYDYLSNQHEIASNILKLASQNHPLEAVVLYRNTIKSAWDKLDGCYDDASDPDIGDRDNIQQHIYDLLDYIEGLIKNLHLAMTAVGPRFSSSIFPFLDTFESNIGRKLLRGTAWNYKISFMVCITSVWKKFSNSIMSQEYNPFNILNAAIAKAMADSKSQVSFIDSILPTSDYEQRKTEYSLEMTIGHSTLLVGGPNDLKNMEEAIKKALSIEAV